MPWAHAAPLLPPMRCRDAWSDGLAGRLSCPHVHRRVLAARTLLGGPLACPCLGRTLRRCCRPCAAAMHGLTAWLVDSRAPMCIGACSQSVRCLAALSLA